jgi:hypothetical protein
VAKLLAILAALVRLIPLLEDYLRDRRARRDDAEKMADDLELEFKRRRNADAVRKEGEKK